MDRIKSAIRRWKEKNWDERPVFHDDPIHPSLGFERPPIRAFWEYRKGRIITISNWLLALVAGAAILRLLGLG